MLVEGKKATHAPHTLLEFRARIDVFTLLRAGALVDGVVSNWRFDNGLLLRLTFNAPNLILEHGSQRQQVPVSWYSPHPTIIRPHLHCPLCGRGCYRLYEVNETFLCRSPCGGLDYSCRHVNRHTPQLNRIARLRRKLGVDHAPFAPLPSLLSLRPKQRKMVGAILALEQGVVASMAAVADDLEGRAKKSGMLCQ